MKNVRFLLMIFVVTALIFTACGPVATPEPEVVEEPVVEEPDR